MLGFRVRVIVRVNVRVSVLVLGLVCGPFWPIFCTRSRSRETPEASSSPSSPSAGGKGAEGRSAGEDSPEADSGRDSLPG